MREIKDIALLDSAIGSTERQKIIQLRRHVDIYFELSEIDYFPAPAAGSKGQLDGLIVEMGTKIGQYELQYSEAGFPR